MIAQPQPRLTIALPPVYKPRLNETIQFDFYCFGRDRHAVGQVLEITQGGIPLVRYQVALPSEAETRADYPYSFKYPKDGIHRGDVYLPLEQVRPYDGEQLSINDKATENDSAIARLEAERDRLLSEGWVPPEGAELIVGKCHKRNCYQAVWRAETAILPGKRKPWVKHMFVGMKGSPGHKKAIADQRRRAAIARINRQISILEGLRDD